MSNEQNGPPLRCPGCEADLLLEPFQDDWARQLVERLSMDVYCEECETVTRMFYSVTSHEVL